MKNCFNKVTSHDDLGDVLFDTENSLDDVKYKIDSFSDEDEQKFIGAML